MAVDLTKHDVAINDVGYRVSSYSKREASSFVPRFNTGAESENHLDFWKEISINDFSGGAFQIDLIDRAKSFFSFGRPNQSTKKLNSAPELEAIGTYSNNGHRTTLSVYYTGHIYFFTDNALGASSTSKMYKLNSSTDATSTVSLPGALSTNNYMTDAVVFEDKMYIASKTSTVHSWDGTTFVSTSVRLEKLCVYRDVLYGIAEDGGLHSLSGTTWSLVKRFGEKQASTNAPNKMMELNGRLYIGKPEGLFAYDGVQVVRVVDYSLNQYSDNFKYMAIHNGWLYYNVNSIIYRFNGLTVEKIFTDNQFQIKGMLSAGEDLFIFTKVVSLSPYVSIAGIDHNRHWVLRFDGFGFSYYGVSAESVGSTTSYHFMYQNRKLYLEWGYVGGGGSTADVIKKLSIDPSSTPANRLAYISSNIDMSLPEVKKYAHKLNVTMSKEGSGTLSLDVWLMYKDATGAWSTLSLGATSSSLVNEYNLFENYSGYVDNVEYSSFSFQIVVVATIPAGSNCTLEDLSLRYSINPALRWAWVVNLLCYGTAMSPLELKDGTDETVSASTLRETLYDARRAYLPAHFVDLDFDLLSGAHNNSVTTITVVSTNTFPESGIILIGTEKIKYTGKTATTFTGCTRGYLGTSASSHSSADPVYNLYLATITRISQEKIIPDPGNLTDTSTKYISEIQIEIEQSS